MTTAYTSLLGLALPVTGELSGTWGDTVNTAITSLLDSAVAGTTSITVDADITLTSTTGASNEARQAIILWNPASGTTTRNITAPAQSKLYTVINASGGTQSIVIRGAGPTTGVTIAKGESAQVAWNGSDFVKVGSSGGAATFTNLTVTGNTILGDAAADTLTVNATSTFAAPVSFQGLVNLPSTGRSAAAALTPTNPAFLYGVASTYTDTTSSGTLAPVAPFYSIARPTLATSNVTTYTNAATLYIANSPAAGGSATITNPFALYVAAGANYFGGSVTLDAGTANGVAYLNGAKVLTTGSALAYDGTTFSAPFTSLSGNGVVLTVDRTGTGGNDRINVQFSNSGTVRGGIGTVGASDGIYFNYGTTEGMRLSSVGLSVKTTDTYGVVSIQRYSGAPQSTLALGDFSTIANDVGIYLRTTSTAGISWPTGGALKLYGGGPGTTERAQIDANGRFLLGTSTASTEGIMTIGTLTSSDKNGIVMNRGAAGSVSPTQVGLFNELNGIATGEALTMRTPNGFKWQNIDGTSEWMRLVGSTGNLLLGTTTSVSRLTVSGNATFGQISPLTRFFQVGSTGIPLIRYDDNGYGNVVLQNLGITAANQGFRLTAQFSDDGTNAYDAGYIMFLTDSTFTSTASTRDSSLIFATTLDGTMTEKVRITGGGRVGINTTAPGSLLEVIGASAVDTTGSSGAWTVRLRDTTSTALAGTGSSLLFQGIKATTGGVGNYAAIAGLKENSTNNNEDGYLGFFTVPNSTGLITERGRFSSTGNFGIGATSPQARLHIYQDSSSTSVMSGAYIQNFSSTTNAQAGIGFWAYDNFNAKIYTLRSGSSDGNLIFATNNGTGTAESNVTEKARITKGGAFIVGGTSAANSAVITASGAGTMGMSAYVGNNNGTINTIAYSTGSGGGLIIVSGVSFGSGQSFSRLYLAGVRVAGGAGSVFTTTISSVGEAGVSFTFAESGGYIQATASGLPSGTWTVMWINC